MTQHIGRRELLRGLGLGAALLVTGCESAVARQERVVSAGPPEPGGTAQLGLLSDLVPKNLFTNTGPAITTLIGLVYDRLVRYGPSGLEPRPALATSWTPAPDGTALTLLLRDDVRFHSGRPFTAADVEFSLRSYADPKWNGQLRSTAAAITGIDVVGPHEVVLRFADPLSNIFDLLDTVPIIDSDSIDDLRSGTRFVGTGPFRFDGWRPNTELRFTRNPDYFVPGRPYLDGVRARIIPEKSSLLSALKSGQVHLADTLGHRDVESAVRLGTARAITLTGAELQAYVGTNVTTPPLDDVRIRRAIAHALDRERIITEVFRGAGYATSLPWPQDSPAHDEVRARRYARDLPRARALVAEHGPVPVLPLVYAAKDPSLAAVAQIVQNNLAEVGIDVRLEPLDRAQFTQQLIAGGFRGLWVATHSWAQMTPSTLAVSAYPFNARQNASHFSSPDYTRAADAAWQLPGDPAGAHAALSDQLLDELFLIEIGVYWQRWAHSPALQGIGYSRRRELDLTEAFLA
ncbi:ABC transporter substrate-binding protein [Saccharopolyspora sp. NPDC000359]|uniref:ABC transporter substrate-binding protein n=1 Tax=Saccharopolyspora sp. NPDC000359 TaxID=3154251 RepID=UPI00332A03A9